MQCFVLSNVDVAVIDSETFEVPRAGGGDSSSKFARSFRDRGALVLKVRRRLPAHHGT